MYGLKSKTLRGCAEHVWMLAHGKREEFGKAEALRYVEEQRRILREPEYEQIVEELQLKKADPVATVFTFIEEDAA